MIAVIVYRPEVTAGDGGFDPATPFEGFEIVGFAPNHLAADALLAETMRNGRAIGQPVETWQWLVSEVPQDEPPEFTWTGWLTADDSGDGDVPDGLEWLSIEEDGEEYAIVVLRTKASIFEGKPDDLTAARAAREIRANVIVKALNAMVERGDYP